KQKWEFDTTVKAKIPAVPMQESVPSAIINEVTGETHPKPKFDPPVQETTPAVPPSEGVPSAIIDNVTGELPPKAKFDTPVKEPTPVAPAPESVPSAIISGVTSPRIADCRLQIADLMTPVFQSAICNLQSAIRRVPATNDWASNRETPPDAMILKVSAAAAA